jgi:hypothetical protein
MTKEEAMGIAARIWCEDKHSHKIMDAAFAISIADALMKVRADTIEECATLAESEKFKADDELITHLLTINRLTRDNKRMSDLIDQMTETITVVQTRNSIFRRQIVGLVKALEVYALADSTEVEAYSYYGLVTVERGESARAALAKYKEGEK